MISRPLFILSLLIAHVTSCLSQGIGTVTNNSLEFNTNNAYRGQVSKEGYFLLGGNINHNNERLQDSGTSYFDGDMRIIGNLNLVNNNNTVNIGAETSPTGFSSVFLGYQAGLSYSGGYTIAVGRGCVSGAGSAPRQNTLGFQANTNPSDADNCTFGSYIGTISLGGYNSLFGNYVAYNASSDANNNTSIGYISLYKITHGSYNSTWGSQTGYNTTTGNYNIFGGYAAGYYNVTGNNDIYLGKNSGGTASDASDSMDIGGIIEGKMGNPYIGITVRGSTAYSLMTTDTNYSITASDRTIKVTNTLTITLPDTSLYGIKGGHDFVIINTDSTHTITVIPISGTINQQTSITLNKYRTTVTFDGENYFTD